ncbi:MAG: RagB/SusD family nutrient uptake outer membrane protein [Prevotellaceae bacterium]|jgi:hypothetical protein|nr:RagB/SusD family nutrient uptake outer membrane protein [Prevotellaceae bacterium]
MKQLIKKISFFLIGIPALFNSCMDDLLNQPDHNKLSDYYFWTTTADAEYALNGTAGDIRYLFNRDYYFDGLGEFLRVRGNTLTANSATLQGGLAYRGFYSLYPTNGSSSFDKMYESCFGGINRANYVIDGVEKMLEKESAPDIRSQLESIIGEAKLLRSLVYFRLISMWGDVPYIDQRIYADEEVAYIKRTPIAEIVPKLIEDLTYAFDKLPVKATVSGRMSKPAALALRGKIQLYWACWNNFGWPELDGFTPDKEKALAAYRAAASDFRHVIDDYGLNLFRGGEPGECDELGKAEKLPNYYYLFLPTANGDSEFVLSFNFGGVGTAQSDELMRDFAGRSVEYSQCWVSPRFAIADRYQSITTGDFCDPLVGLPPNGTNREKPNSAVNPESYANRDYRMKSTILWDYEMCMGITAQEETGYVPYIYNSWGIPVTIGGVNYTTYDTDGSNSGYVFRKFVRNYSNGQARSQGDFNWPVIRLADVYLMYAEAVNAANLAEQKDYAVEMVNRVRHRGNLPALTADKTATPEAFFAAIEQERIVELVGEGQRSFDIRRWRAIEKTFVPPFTAGGITLYNTWGSVVAAGLGEVSKWFDYLDERAYERCYIFRIPPAERDRNSNLTQNKPFL